MHDYRMFADGDRVLIAVSGGVDSLVLAALLVLWQKKAPIRFTLVARHIDHGFWPGQQVPPQESIGNQLRPFALPLEIVAEWSLGDKRRDCFQCARNRRSQLFALAKLTGCNKIAFGHHKDDLIETFLLNAVYSGTIATMVPRQDIFAGDLAIVRPLAYLSKVEVRQIADNWGLVAVDNLCPLVSTSRRETIRKLLDRLYAEEPAARDSLFAALGNVRPEYLPDRSRL